MIQYLSGVDPDPKRTDVRSLVLCGCLGSRLQADPRIQAFCSVSDFRGLEDGRRAVVTRRARSDGLLRIVRGEQAP